VAPATIDGQSTIAMSLSKLRVPMRGQAALPCNWESREAQRPQLNVERKAIMIETD